MATTVIAQSRNYKSGQMPGGTVTPPAGTLQAQMEFSGADTWPLGSPVADITIEVSYDGGNTWIFGGGFEIWGVAPGTVDPLIGPITKATLKTELSKPADSNTRVRLSSTVLQDFTTAISVTTFP